MTGYLVRINGGYSGDQKTVGKQTVKNGVINSVMENKITSKPQNRVDQK